VRARHVSDFRAADQHDSLRHNPPAPRSLRQTPEFIEADNMVTRTALRERKPAHRAARGA